MYGKFDYYGAPDIEQELDEFRLLPCKKGDLRCAKKGSTVAFKTFHLSQVTNAPKKGGETRKVTVTGDEKDSFGAKVLLAKDKEGNRYKIPIGIGGVARTVLRSTGGKDKVVSTSVSGGPAVWLEGVEMSGNLVEACKKSRKEEIEAEIAALESTDSPFPEVREQRIEELRAELEEAKSGDPQWGKAAEKLLKKSLQSRGKGQEDLHYRAYLRAIVNGTPSGHLTQKFSGAKQARQDLIDLAGRM